MVHGSATAKLLLTTIDAPGTWFGQRCRLELVVTRRRNPQELKAL